MLLLVVGLVVGEIVLRSREHQRVAAVRDVEIHQMRNFAQLSAGNEPIGRLVRVLQDELVAILHVDERALRASAVHDHVAEAAARSHHDPGR